MSNPVLKCDSKFCIFPPHSVSVSISDDDHYKTIQRPAMRFNRYPISNVDYEAYLAARSTKLGAILRGCGTRQNKVDALQQAGVPIQVARFDDEMLVATGETAGQLLRRASKHVDNVNYSGVKLRPATSKAVKQLTPQVERPMLGVALPDASDYCQYYGADLISSEDWSAIAAVAPPKEIGFLPSGAAEWMGHGLLMFNGRVDTWWGRVRDWLNQFSATEKTPVGFRCSWDLSPEEGR